jgi:hypothetical protein
VATIESDKGRPSGSKGTAMDLLQKLVAKIGDLSADPDTADLMAAASVSLEVELREPGGDFATLQVAIRRPTNSLTAAGSLALAREDPAAEPEFNSEGHHVIALIAARDLANGAPDVMATVQAILDAADRTIQEAATFPDDIRASQPATKPFHFVDIPFERGGPINPPLPEAPHVLSKIDDFTAALRTAAGDPEATVNALSWLIHLFGDVHQPLHCIERISDLHPGGDRGGNSFRIAGSKRNLHSLWDSSVNVTESLTESELAERIMTTHPRASLSEELAIDAPEAWARSSHALARKHAYSLQEDPDRPPRPSAAYIRNMEQIGRKHAALGGYRLANRLIAIFGANQ